MKTIKLTPAQKEVILKMRDGWKLRYYPGLGSRWLEWTELFKSNESATVNILTYKSLKDKGFIENDELTDLGKSIEL